MFPVLLGFFLLRTCFPPYIKCTVGAASTSSLVIVCPLLYALFLHSFFTKQTNSVISQYRGKGNLYNSLCRSTISNSQKIVASPHSHTRKLYLRVSPDDPLLFHRFTRLLERLAAEDDFPSPTCMRTTVDVVNALRTFLSGLARMM